MPFACSRCAACCRRAGYVPELVELGLAEPGGACRMLEADGSCSVYAVRPRICRVDEMRPDDKGVEEWYRENYAACNAMQEDDGMGEEWRVGDEKHKSGF